MLSNDCVHVCARFVLRVFHEPQTESKNRTTCPEAHLDQEQQVLKPPVAPLDPDLSFNAVNKLWYITDDEGCGQVS